jgi:transcriptional regulator with XRE-family HTH domain
MHALAQDHTGTRIARLRRERHLTQKALCELANISYSTLTKIEQGRIPATPHVIAAVARAMRVEVATIQGQPYAQELRADELDVLLTPIRSSLAVYDLGPDPDIRARTVAELHIEAEELCAKVRAGDIKAAASQVAGLIEEATTAAHLAQTPEGWRTLASFYRTAYDVAAKLGFPDLAELSLVRLDWAAQRAGDAVLGGMYLYLRALTYLRRGEFRMGSRLVDLGLATLEQADAGRERLVMTGQLHLGAAVVAGRDDDRDQAETHLAEADRIATETGEAVRVHWLAFGPTNTAVHRVSVLAEVGEYAKAVTTAGAVLIPRDWPKSRVSHHYTEVAHAQMWVGRREESFRSLLLARKAAPQQAKYHPTVRATYAALEAARRRLPDSFLSYGAWLGPASAAGV